MAVDHVSTLDRIGLYLPLKVSSSIASKTYLDHGVLVKTEPLSLGSKVPCVPCG